MHVICSFDKVLFNKTLILIIELNMPNSIWFNPLKCEDFFY